MSEYVDRLEEIADKYVRLEQSWMVLKDQYSEIARALGFEGDAWFGDPFASHEEIVKEAKALYDFAKSEGAA